MTGSMWVESEVSKGSKFFFTITSQIGQLSMEAMLAKMAPFGNRNILFVDTLFDNTGVVDRIQELGLRPYVIHDPLEVADKATCPHIDTIVVDSLSVVRPFLIVVSGLQRLTVAATDRDDPRIRASAVHTDSTVSSGTSCSYLLDHSHDHEVIDVRPLTLSRNFHD